MVESIGFTADVGGTAGAGEDASILQSGGGGGNDWASVAEDSTTADGEEEDSTIADGEEEDTVEHNTAEDTVAAVVGGYQGLGTDGEDPSFM